MPKIKLRNNWPIRLTLQSHSLPCTSGLQTNKNGRRLELLKGHTDQILVFCGLFSATVAALITPWLSDLSFPSSSSPANGKARYIGSGNKLWFWALIVNISCALTALSLQQWVRPRTWVTLSHYSLPEQARLSALFAARIERSHRLVKNLHTMILYSLILFFTGLLLLSFNVDRTLFYTTLLWTIVFFFYHGRDKSAIFFETDTPSYTPFAQARAEEPARHIDDDILKRILDMLRSDDDLEQFFQAIPGFCASKLVDDPRRSLDTLGRQRLAGALVAFWNRTLSSNWASESVKGRRLLVCMRVIEAADLSIAVPQILHLLSGDLSEVSRSVEIGHSLRPLRNGNAASLARGIIASIISGAEHNDRWFTLAMDELGISGGVLRDYLAHGDSVLLATLIHITRHLFHSFLQHDLDLTRKSSSILSSLSKFDILNTLPELQRDFCDLWNEVVQQAQSSRADDNPFIDILVEIRRLYVDLHGTDIALGYFFTSTTGHDDLFYRPASYPLCMMPDHRPIPTTHTQEASGSTTDGASQIITKAPPVLFESSPGDVLDVSHHTATDMDITQGIVETYLPSMAGHVTQSPSTSGDHPQDEEITRQEFSSSNASLPSNPQVPMISAPSITSGTAIPSATTGRANDNGQDLRPY